MKRGTSYLKYAAVAFASLLFPIFLTSCTFICGNVGCDLFGKVAGPGSSLPVSQPTSSSRAAVFEDPGTIIVIHGSSCAESKKSGTQVVLMVEESLDLPRYAGNATVFLNGWHLRYLNGDENVAGLGTSIFNITLSPGAVGQTLRWQAAGALFDDNFDNPYSWCYNYTVVAWNPANLNLVVDQDDGPCSGKPEETRFANYFGAQNAGTTTALSSFPSFLENPGFASGRTVAVLPRGFGFEWTSDSGCPEDHHLIQTAYNLDHGEIFMEKGKKYRKGLGDTTRGDESIVDQGFVSWETYAIFKDDDTRRDYGFAEMVSGLGGSDVGIIQPPFSILPKEDEGFFTSCLGGIGIETHDHAIENVPYKYVIPMLTGWDLYYGCSDQKVREIGTWIDAWDYNPGNPGTLHYKLSAILTDDDGLPLFVSRHKVALLVLKPVVLRAASPAVKE